jgi:ATP-dependent Clp protease adapter protein ClpS
MTDDKMTPEEIVADIIWDHFGDCNMIWQRHLEQADEILNAIHYHELIALVLERDREIAELKTQISFERDINAGREDQLNDDIKFLRSKLPTL